MRKSLREADPLNRQIKAQMSKDSEAAAFAAFNAERQRERAERRRNECGAYASARSVAESLGMRLVQRSDVHYQLSPGVDMAMHGGAWLLNLYPGNQRLYHDRSKSRPPYLDLPDTWTLIDVVRAMAKATKDRPPVHS